MATNLRLKARVASAQVSSRVRPRSVLPNTLTRTDACFTRSSNGWHTSDDHHLESDQRLLGGSHEGPFRRLRRFEV
jgi:hypothetical protein